MSNKRLIVAVVLLAGIVSASGCSSGDKGERMTHDPGGDVSGFCAEVALAESSGQPLDLIEVSGLDVFRRERPIGELSAVYLPTNHENEIVAPVEIGPEGQVLLVVPAHPAGIEGGKGVVRLTDDQGLPCPPVELAVDSIPPAPGETVRVVDALHELVVRRVELLGFDPESVLTQALNELPAWIVPHVAALEVLRNETDGEQIRESLERQDEQLAIADAVFARADAAQQIRDELERLRELTAPSRQVADRWTPSRQQRIRTTPPWAALALLQGPQPGPNTTFEVLNNEPLAITDAEQLSHYMRLQAAAESHEQDMSWDVVRNVGAVSNLVVSVVTGPLGKFICAMRWVEGTSGGAMAGVLPCCLDSYEYDLSNSRFEEDYDLPPFARWSNVRVTASNRGWNLTDPTAAAVGCAFPGGSTLLPALTPDLDSLEIPPTTWGPIPLTPGPRWNEAEAEGAIRTVSVQDYAPTMVGTGKLTVETLRGRFGNAHKGLAKQVEVAPIIINVTPGVQRVEPPGSAELRAYVRDSVNPEQLKWKVWTKRGAQHRDFDSSYVGDGVHRISISLPDEEADYPLTVEAESISRTGLRKHATERRYGTAMLTTGVVVDIGPEPACVDTKPPPLQMFAEVVGTENTGIDWRVMSGPARINDDGEVTATGEGEAIVRGTSVVDDEAWDEAAIDVGKCTCSFSAILSGDTNTTNARGEVAHFSTEGKTTIMGAFSNPEVLEDVMGMFGGMMGEEQQQRAEEWKREMESMPRETLGISLAEMHVEDADEQMIANFVGGFKLQASVMNRPIEPGFAGGLNLSHVLIHTGEYTEGGYPTKYEWVPGVPGNVSLIVNHYNGRSLSGTFTGNMFAPGLYKESTREPPQISFSVYFYGLVFDPLNGLFGCIAAEGG